MRDILIVAIIAGTLPFILRNARNGVYVWAWLAMMIPHRAAYGFARQLPLSHIVAVTTLLSFLFSKDRRPFPLNAVTVIYLSFFFWMSITSLFALNTPEVVFERWLFVTKIHLMLFVTFMLLRGRKQIENLIWIVTLSIGFYGFKGGIYTILTGGGGRVWGPSGGMIQDNNALGLALVTLIPFFYYLYHQLPKKRLYKWGFGAVAICNCIAVLGTQSRGALLALTAMLFFLILKGKHPIKMALMLIVACAPLWFVMPESWTGRMKTIDTYEQDTSAMSRIYAWKTMWALAVDRPLVGGGFSADTPEIYRIYAPIDGAGVYTAGGAFVAHSIYFQALAEHGFPGLILYILLGIASWFKASQLARRCKNDPEYAEWVPLLMKMVQASLAGFAVGGAFLSLVNFDLPYYILGYVILVEATIREKTVLGPSLKAPPSSQ